ncbi:hypothetical protein PUN28_014474 [Cardiocondyla obscurior]|uniref:Uncharacterized protein n=1 Tax=Cardiocondyla obscurior TaxID=286306 RepID=A0AAW2F5D2_9HYME
MNRKGELPVKSHRICSISFFLREYALPFFFPSPLFRRCNSPLYAGRILTGIFSLRVLTNPAEMRGGLGRQYLPAAYEISHFRSLKFAKGFMKHRDGLFIFYFISFFFFYRNA